MCCQAVNGRVGIAKLFLKIMASVVVTATLNGSVSNDITIPLQFSGSAAINSDYSVSSDNILINNGNTTGSVTISAIQDNEIESPEEIIIDLLANSDYLLVK